jgi:hypothetical protein
MAYTIDVFTAWPGYSSWEALKSWLISEDGGKLRVVEPRESRFALVRYVKGQSDFSKNHVRWCRSVVVEKETRLPVCVSPPKASELKDDTLECVTSAEEFVDGTMLNVFKAGNDMIDIKDDPLISTRSMIGGKGRFYDNGPSFDTMLREALEANGIKSLRAIIPHSVNADSMFTSLVLQHPSNRIVKSIQKPTFQIVHQGRVSSNGIVTIYEDVNDFVCEVGEGGSEDFFEVQPYALAAIRGAKNVQEWVTKQAQERGFGWQGVVLKDGTGNRWRVRSAIYETVRRIRGNESTDEERFARLRSTRSIEQYLSFYPEDREKMYALEGTLRKNTRQLFHFYADVFRARKTAYHELPWPYKHHVSVLHNLYKDVLRKSNKKIDLDEVIRYVNGLGLEDHVNMAKTHKLELKKSDPVVPVAPVAETSS